MKRMLGAVLALLAMSVVLAGGANAQSTAPQDLGVSITITDECTVSNIQNVAFGSHGNLASAVTATGSVDVYCTTDLPYQISLDAGDGAGATTAIRYMTGPDSATLSYGLFRDDEHTLIWGEDDGEDYTTTGTGTGTAQTHTIYGRVPAQTTPAAGEYSDTVAVVVHY
jgi:spore coat protein U-like protein